MTTIATDGKTIACDSQQDTGFINQVKSKKIFKIPNGWAGAAGEAGPSLAALNWIRNGGDKPDLSSGDFSLVILRDSGVFTLENDLIEIPVGIPFAAGSGAPYAMGAMLSGKTAPQAVRLAIKLDPFSGGQIVTKKL